MSRVEIDLSVQSIDTVTGRLNAATGKSVQVNLRNADGTNGASATVYTTPLGGTTYTQPLTTDLAGRVDGWVDQNSYNLVVSGTGITTYTQAWEAMPAGTLVSTWKVAARTVALANTTIASPGAAVGGVTMASSDRVLLTAQSTASQNGLWIWNGAAVPMTRPSDFNSAISSSIVGGTAVWVNEGTTGDSLWVLSADNLITIDTTAQTWIKIYPTTKTMRSTHTYTVTGTVALPSGETNYLPPFYVAPVGAQTTTLVGVYAVLHAGTGTTTVRIDKNGATTGTSINVPTTTATLTSMATSLATGDRVAPVVTAVGTTPQNMTLTFVMEHVF